MSTSNRHEIANSVMSLIHNRDERRLDAKKNKKKKNILPPRCLCRQCIVNTLIKMAMHLGKYAKL